MKEKLNLLTKLKSITYKFSPLDPKAKSLRSFIPLTSNSRVHKGAPDCKIVYNLTDEAQHPEITIKYVNGLEQSIKTENLDLQSIVDTIELLKKSIRVEEIQKIKTVETTLQDILQPVTKKKDTGAKANR